MRYSLWLVLGLVYVKSFALELNIRVVTEEFPPYNYTQDNKLVGLSTNIVQAVFKELKINPEIRVYPWVRAYQTALNEPNTLIFSIGRNHKRENLFNWIGVIAPAKSFLFRLPSRNDIVISTLQDAKPYLMGTFPESVREQYLIGNGFEKGVHLVSTYSYEKSFNLLVNKRIDLWAMNELVAYYIARKAGYDPHKTLKKTFFLKELSPEGYYMAFNKETDDTIVQAFKNGLEAIKQKGLFQQIQQQHFGK
ncbi:substrate-binding periplasmic protein [Zooshikella harenae]|uniref:Transporter substrate-binding domain-containing protein n=1 Tax=Zooshikella harenae TaxID=2827238 RepID=A0ABS5Z8C8_9GAMM|nr:transporter substrate-binding domain-containing protein [Zooshikella harenae]MBU2710297.1 transporter substrate-binding domain-containing protein [Zooshikella harenae]